MSHPDQNQHIDGRRMNVAKVELVPINDHGTAAVDVYLEPHRGNQFFIDCSRILEVLRDVIDRLPSSDWLATTMQQAHGMYTTGGGGAIQLNEDLTILVTISVFHVFSNPNTWTIDGAKIDGILEQKQWPHYGFFFLVGDESDNKEKGGKKVSDLAEKIAEAMRAL